jgi:surfeit locus 1 family protein
MTRSRPGKSPWPALCAIALIALFTALGFWQVGRYEVKLERWKAFEQAGEQAPVTVDDRQQLDSLDPYTPVELHGRYDLSRQILLDNRVHDGRLGVEVFTPLRLDAGGMVLINRGWLPMQRDRRQLPRAPGPEGRVSPSGLAVPPPSPGLKLGEVHKPDDWPWLTPYLFMGLVRETLDQPLAGSVVLLDPEAPGGFRRDWGRPMLSPERHMGYAVQWFALGLTVVAIWLVLTIRGRKREP